MATSFTLEGLMRYLTRIAIYKHLLCTFAWIDFFPVKSGLTQRAPDWLESARFWADRVREFTSKTGLVSLPTHCSKV